MKKTHCEARCLSGFLTWNISTVFDSVTPQLGHLVQDLSFWSVSHCIPVMILD